MIILVNAILKIGRAITEKDKEVNSTALLNIFSKLAEYKQNKALDLIVIYSIGPVHNILDDLLLRKKTKAGTNANVQRLEYSKVQLELSKVRTKINEILLQAKIPWFNIYPSNLFTSAKRRVKESNDKIIANFIKLGYLPVSSGSLILGGTDDAMGLTYLPGDEVVFELAKKLRPEMLLFGTDVDGIHLENPKESYAELDILEEIKLREIPKIIRHLSLPEKSLQSTKDLRRKLDSTAIALEREWIRKAHVLNLNYPDRLIDVLEGNETRSTLLKR